MSRGRGVDWYAERVREDAYVHFIAADNTAMVDYPSRLGRAKECSPSVMEKADLSILDSAIGDESVGNAEVIEEADRHNADIILPADKLHDPEVTTERTIDMLLRLEEADISPELWVSLQCSEDIEEGVPYSDLRVTHLDHYESLRGEMREYGFDPRRYPVAIGGIRDAGITDQLESVISVRERTGPDTHLHALGLGCSWDWMVIIQRCPWLLDSFDNSTIAKSAINGRAFDCNFDRLSFKLPRGQYSTFLSAKLRGVLFHLVCYMMGPYVNDNDRPIEFSEINDAEELETMVCAHTDRFAPVLSEEQLDLVADISTGEVNA